MELPGKSCSPSVLPNVPGHQAVCRLLLLLFLVGGLSIDARAEAKFMIVIIDGARYSETFGDPNHTYVPNMWNLRSQGTYLSHFYNDSLTYTSRAIPALWCGTWTEVRDTVYNGNNTQYAVKPTIFEYYRGQKNLPAAECFYVLKFITSLWLPSFHPSYGPATWPQYHSVGFRDADVADETQWVMSNYHPHFLWVYLADVDNAGHSGIWSNYVRAIQSADSIVSVLWNALQADPFYQDSTYLFVTNDHGRHDDQHGGFSGHGDGCEGCRHIMFLALGPQIKQNYVSAQYRRIPDMAVTASHLLGINPEYATGQTMYEMMQPTGVEIPEKNSSPEYMTLYRNYPNPFNPSTTIAFDLPYPSRITLQVFDINGRRVRILLNKPMSPGRHEVKWDGTNHAGQATSSGVYFYRLESATGFIQSRKMLLLK